MLASVLADVFALSAKGSNLSVVDLDLGDDAVDSLDVKRSHLSAFVVGDT